MKRFYTSILTTLLFVNSCGTKAPAEDTHTDDNKKSQIISFNLVDTIILRSGTFRSQLISNGKLRATQKSDLKFSGMGVVTVLDVSNGQHVSAGSLIAKLDSRDALFRLEQAQQGMQKAHIDLQDALLGFGYNIKDTINVPKETMRIARLRSGYDGAITSLNAAQLSVEGTEIRAPFAGKIANLKTKLHENPKGDFFCSVINDRAFDVEFNILESELGGVAIGQEVSVSTFVDPGTRHRGKITHINPTVDEKGQIAVTANIPNPGSLLDGMNIKVYIERSVPNRLVVPKSAVLVRDNREVLFRYDPVGKKAMWTYVVIEMSNSEAHVVRANVDRGAELNIGDVVIVSGNLNLADGSAVEIIEKN